jgi:hypothetical protein
MSEQQRTIRILVDSFEDIQVRGALPQGLGEGLQRVVDVGLETLERGIDDTLRSLFLVLGNSALESEQFEVDGVRFTLRVDASGGVSLASLVKGSLGAQSGLEFNIARRKKG